MFLRFLLRKPELSTGLTRGHWAWKQTFVWIFKTEWFKIKSEDAVKPWERKILAFEKLYASMDKLMRIP